MGALNLLLRPEDFYGEPVIQFLLCFSKFIYKEVESAKERK